MIEEEGVGVGTGTDYDTAKALSVPFIAVETAISYLFDVGGTEERNESVKVGFFVVGLFKGCGDGVVVQLSWIHV